MSLRSPRSTVPADPDRMSDYLYEKGYTDGLPVVPPTEERVAAMVRASGRDPEQVIAYLDPLAGPATVEAIAANAVMAGCLPEYMPVLIAAVQAVAAPEFNLLGIQTTTNPVGPMIIVNGPVRELLKVNSGIGCMGPGWRANATIGRALRLFLINIGGGIPGSVDKATLGMPGKFTFCIGENEEESPWEPFQTDRGFGPQESTVTVYGGHATLNVLGAGKEGHSLARWVARAMLYAGCNNFAYDAEALLVMTPAAAIAMAEAGFSKMEARRFFSQNCWLPADWFAERSADPSMDVNRRKRAIDGKLFLAERPENFLIVVAGGMHKSHSTFVPSFGQTKTVTKRVELK